MTIFGGLRARLICGAILLVIGLIILLAVVPVSWAKSIVERRISDELGSRVTIASLTREQTFSFNPVVAVKGISVPQPRWAGEGYLARIEVLRLRIAIISLVFGKVNPELVSARGIHLDLVRLADGRENWRNDRSKAKAKRDFDLTHVSQADGTVRYRDDRQRRRFSLDFRVSPGSGITASGKGAVDGNPLTLRANGAAARAGKPWPFEARIDGAALAMHLKGTMAAPLQTDRMSFSVDARAADLKLIDRVIEAGLFGTQPVSLSAQVQRTPDQWRIRKLKGTVGTSLIDGQLDVSKVGERTKLDGQVHSSRLDFEDLASDAGNAAAAALERAEGIKIVPNLRVNVRKIDHTDGRMAFRIERIVSARRPSSLRSASGVLDLDHRLLKIERLRIGLSQGEITGHATVDQRRGQPEPTVTLALDLNGSSIDALAGGNGAIDAPVSGRVRLTGVGSTIREAVGRSNGRVGLYAGQGALPEKLARLLGFDVGALFAKGSDHASLRCGAIGLDMKAGSGRVSTLIVDTSVSQSSGSGVIHFPDERIAVSLTGAPKAKVTLRLPGSALVRGSVREPEVMVPKDVKSVGNVLKAIGRAISGNDGPRAGDADCSALRRAVIN